jgi:hypothetical protein
MNCDLRAEQLITIRKVKVTLVQALRLCTGVRSVRGVEV